MGRGRPIKSAVRNRMQMIVDALGVTYGYEIHKAYEEIFEPIELRSMYYHLKKGVQLNDFEEIGVEKVKGPFTWGDVSIRKYYILGPEAGNRATEEVRKVIEKGDFEKRDPGEFVSWESIADNYKKKLKDSLKKKLNKKKAVELLNKTERFITWFNVNGFVDLKELENIKKKVEKEIKKI